MKKTLLFFAAAIFALNTTAFAQHKPTGEKRTDTKVENTKTESTALVDSNFVDVVTMQDGARYMGKIITLDAETLTIQLLNDTKQLALKRVMVSSIESLDAATAKLGMSNQFGHSLLINNTGLMLQKGKGTYQTLDFLSHRFNYAASNNVELTLGIDLIFLTGQVKFGGQLAKNVNASITLGGAIPFTGSSSITTNPNGSSVRSSTGGFLSASSAITFGSSNSFLNLGGGAVGIVGGNVFNPTGVSASPDASTWLPYFHLGGFHRVNQNWSMMTDNTLIIFPTNINGATARPLFVPTFGARYFAGKKTALDFGLTYYGITSSYQNIYNYTTPQTTTYTTYVVLPYLGIKTFL